MSSKNLIQICRIYPTDKQKKMIEDTFNACREIHNLILKERRYVYNKFISYARRCYINKIKVEEDRFFKNNVPINKFEGVNRKYENIDRFAIYNEQLSVMEEYDKYFAGKGAFPSEKKENKYGIRKVNDNVQVSKNYIKLPCLGNVRINQNSGIPNNIDISKVLVRCNKKGEYYVVFILKDKVSRK